jgi:hypothetical protein
MKRYYRGTLYCVLLFLLAFVIAGCSGGEQVLGSNSRTEVTIESNNIDDLRLIISPLEGAANDSGACTETSAGTLNCTLETPDNFTTLLRFDTNSDASNRPYHVYVRNAGNATRQFSLDIRMDGTIKLSRNLTVDANQTLFVARIFRNNADRP